MTTAKDAPRHNKLGNCWHKSVAWKRGVMQDACAEHDEPRGECSECPRCPACDYAQKRGGGAWRA